MSFFSSSSRTRQRPLTLISSVMTIICIGGCSQKSPANDALFLDALKVANSGNPALLDQYQMGMQNSVLQYYPEYWKLNNNLAMQPGSAIVGFAQRYPKSALAEKLAADYIEEKVKAGDYSAASSLIELVSAPDASEQCALTQVRAATRDPLALLGNQSVWLSTATQPETCQGLVRMMLNSEVIPVKDKQQRVLSQLRAGAIGNAFAAANSMGMPLSLSRLNQIQTNAASYLWHAPKATPQDHAYLIFALGRVAETDLSSALAMVDRVASGTPGFIQKYLYRTVAYVGGTTVIKNGFNPNLVSLFDRSIGYPFSPEECEIYARQSLRFGQWESLLRAISYMTTTQQQEPRWQYWRARALEQRNTADAKTYATNLYRQLAQRDDDYYGLLALDRINVALTPRYSEPTNNDFNRLSQDINFQRAFTLKMLGAPSEYSNREWNWAVRQSVDRQDDGLLLAAAKRAHAMAWYDRAIYAADRVRQSRNHALSYPMPYRAQVISGAQVGNINPAWGYGIMRQESRFVTNARSGVGASGLMQVMPETARVIARKLGEPFDSRGYAALESNIRYGTYYLGMLQQQFDGDIVLATTGYNAGPNRARAWRPTVQSLAADQYIESIPFDETRTYVKNVLSNTAHYATLLGQGSTRLSRYLSAINPASVP